MLVFDTEGKFYPKTPMILVLDEDLRYRFYQSTTKSRQFYLCSAGRNNCWQLFDVVSGFDTIDDALYSLSLFDRKYRLKTKLVGRILD